MADPRLTNLLIQAAGEKEAMRLPQAEELYRKVLARSPYVGVALSGLAAVLAALGRFAEARERLAMAQKLGRADADTLEFAADALAYLGEPGRALNIVQELLAREPTRYGSWCTAAFAYGATNRLDDAARCWNQASQLRPNLHWPLLRLSKLFFDQQRIAESWCFCERALALCVEDAELAGLAADIQVRRGFLSESVQLYRRALAIRPDIMLLHSNLLVALNYLPELDAGQLYEEHRAWAMRFADPLTAEHLPHQNSKEPDRPLRVGYVIPELRQHAVISFFEPLLRHHDRAKYVPYCYTSLQRRDEFTGPLSSLFFAVRDICDRTDEQVAEMIRSDGIDVLVDLCGHTKDHRLLAFARKPAPIQVNSVAYPNTTGMLAMDYRLTDDIADPPGEPQCHSEKLVRLPTGFCCFMPPRAEVDVAPLPAHSSQFLTFGATHALQKLNDQVLDCYAEILKRTPGSRLLMFRSTLSPSQQGRFSEAFLRRSIDPERIIMEYRMPSTGTHLSIYNSIDVLLDAFPWTGHTTSCDALWMGVPTVTVRGGRHASRMVASVLHRVGLDDFIGESPDDFVRIACAWSGRIEELSKIRSSLRERVKNSVLCDAAAYAKAVEDEYRTMWRKWCEGRN